MPASTQYVASPLVAADIVPASSTPRTYYTTTQVVTAVDSNNAPINNAIRIDRWVTFTDGTPQENTITITAGVAGNLYNVLVADSVDLATNPDNWNYTQMPGDTAAIIASKLALALDQDARIFASATGAVITIKSAIAGKPFYLDVTDSSTPANAVVANTVANVAPTENGGVVVHGKYSSTLVTFGVSANSYQPTVSLSNQWFDGDTPVNQLPGGSPSQGPKSFQQMRVALYA